MLTLQKIMNKPILLRKIIRKLMAFMGHCLICTSLDGCYLLNNKRPEQPIQKAKQERITSAEIMS